MKEKIVPTLSIFEKERILFSKSVKWKTPFPTLHHLFHINKLEDVREHLKFPFLPHRQTVFDFVFLTKGKSTRSKGLHKYDFSVNTFFFLPAYQISTHDFMSRNAEGYYCHFDMDIFNRKCINQEVLSDFLFIQFTGHPLVKVDNKTKLNILSILNRLEQESQVERINLDIVSIYLLALMCEVNQFAKHEPTLENAAFRTAQQYKNKLARYIYEKHSVSEYASMLNISPNHLNKCVKSATGKSAQDLLSEMILLEAKVLLRQTTLTVNEIAWKVGKQDASDFIRFFKSKTELTPLEFRKGN